MAVKFTNNARTTLAANITSSATTATVVSGSVFPALEAGEYFYCTFDNGTNNEIVKVTARSGNTLTIVRGVDNTTARAFVADDAAELRATAGLLTDIQANIAAKSANQTVYNATTASSATAYDIGIDPGVEGNAMVFLNGLMQHHDTFSFSGSTLTFDTAPADGMALEVIVDNLINLQSSNLTVDTFTAADVGGNPQVDFTLSDAPAAETNLIVFVDGVFQANDTYTISNLTLSMTDGVTAGLTVTVYVMNPVNIGAPSDGTVTSSKLSGNITMPGTLTVGAFDVAFDSPTFFVDNANSRVGLGTASPTVPVDIVGDVKMSAALDVAGAVDLNNLTINTAQGSDGQVLTSTGSGIAWEATSVADGAITSAKLDTNIAVGGTLTVTGDANFDSNTLFVDASANAVGIGTASPTFSAGGGLNVAHGTFATIRATGGASTGVDFAQASDGKGYVYVRDNADLIFGTNNAERMRITSGGGVVVNGTSTSGTMSVYGSSSGIELAFNTTSTAASIQSYSSSPLSLNALGNNVGIGVSSPVAALHVDNGAGTKLYVGLANNIYYYAYNHIFRYLNGSATYMTIDASGNLLVGAFSSTGASAGFAFNPVGSLGFGTQTSTIISGFSYQHRFYNPNGQVGYISTSGSATSYVTSSDYRLKENVVTDWDATTRLKQLKPSRFNFIANADTTVDGFLAHEVQDIVPEAISGTKDAMQDEEYEVTPAVLDDDGNVVTEAVMGTRSVPDYQGIDQSKLVPLLTKALQEALTKIEQLETRLETLENA